MFSNVSPFLSHHHGRFSTAFNDVAVMDRLLATFTLTRMVFYSLYNFFPIRCTFGIISGEFDIWYKLLEVVLAVLMLGDTRYGLELNPWNRTIFRGYAWGCGCMEKTNWGGKGRMDLAGPGVVTKSAGLTRLTRKLNEKELFGGC